MSMDESDGSLMGGHSDVGWMMPVSGIYVNHQSWSHNDYDRRK